MCPGACLPHHYLEPGDAPLGRLTIAAAPPLADIPTLSEWGLLVLIAMVGVATLMHFGRSDRRRGT